MLLTRALAEHGTAMLALVSSRTVYGLPDQAGRRELCDRNSSASLSFVNAIFISADLRYVWRKIYLVKPVCRRVSRGYEVHTIVVQIVYKEG